jgi:hypothetical protein
LRFLFFLSALFFLPPRPTAGGAGEAGGGTGSGG